MDNNVDVHHRTSSCFSHLGGSSTASGIPGRVVLRLKRRLVLLDESEIDCIDGAANYVKVNVGATAHRVRAKLGEVERALPSDRFLRLQRSTIVNLAAVQELVRSPYGDLAAVLASGRRLTVGRAYRRRLVAALGAAAHR